MLSEKDKDAIAFLRSQTKDLITEDYDTDFNILRWAQGYGFDLDEALIHLRRHLKFRIFYDLDNVESGIKEHEVLKKYFPIGLVGETGHNNELLVIECAGRIDLLGILKSVHLSDFLIQRYRFQEKMLRAMKEMERKHGQQSSVVYIIDLDGLKFDPSLLSIVTGPYRILWASVYTNYPEWISRTLIINAPSFMSIVWKAIAPLLPERTRNKISIHTTNSDWKELLQKSAKPENIPKHWGGKLVDSNGDSMCRDRLNIPFDPIPHNLYWTPHPDTPSIQDIRAEIIPAGKMHIATFVLPKADNDTYIIINRFCDRTFGMGIWYDDNCSSTSLSLQEMIDWCPDFDYPGMPTVDYLRVKVPGPGVYKIKFGNEQAWIRSLTVYYRVRFQNEQKQDVEYRQI